MAAPEPQPNEKLVISLQTSDADLFGDLRLEDNDVESMSSDKRAKPKAKAFAKAGLKATGKTALGRVVWCFMCQSDKCIKANKAACIDCNPDLESMRRDAKASGPKAKAFLSAAEKQAKKEPEYTGLKDIHTSWQAAAGPSTGSSRMGFFQWAKYEEAYIARQGTLAQLGKVQVTKKEFITAMEAKGRTWEWADAEWTRRTNNPEFKKGTCLDTALPTCQMYEGPREIDYTDKAKEGRVVQATKETKPDSEDVKEQVKLVSRAVTDVTRNTSFTAFTADGEGEGMEALMMRAGPGARGFWNKMAEAEQPPVEDSGAAASPMKGSGGPSTSIASATPTKSGSKEAIVDEEYDPECSHSRLQLQVGVAIRGLETNMEITLAASES